MAKPDQSYLSLHKAKLKPDLNFIPQKRQSHDG